MAKEQDKSIEMIVAELEKQFGKGVVTLNQVIPNVEFVTTGCKSIDFALGGGVPRGRIIEIYGAESSGKTTLTLHILAECQKRGEVAAFVDAEHAVDPTYATALGVDLEKLILSQPDSGEQALEIVEALVRSGKVSIVIVDSVSALVPKAEIEGDMGANHPGLQARLMSQAMRKLTGIVSSTNTILIFINQIRMKIGVVYGNPEVTSGGNALKFYASQRIEIRRGTAIKDGESFLGTETNIKVVKNKVAPPFRKAEVTIRYGEGIDKYADIVKLAVDKDIIKKSGSWYSYKEGQLGQGEEKVITYLKEHLDLFEEIKNQL